MDLQTQLYRYRINQPTLISDHSSQYCHSKVNKQPLKTWILRLDEAKIGLKAVLASRPEGQG